jgi:OOP family OmpA-OmpF porin
MFKKGAVPAIAVLMGLASHTAHAQWLDATAGWYGGIDVGRSRTGLGAGDTQGALSRQGVDASVTNERGDAAFGVNLGYRLNRNFAVEAAATKLGDFHWNGVTSAPGVDAITGKYRVGAVSLSAVGFLPIQQNLSLYGKAGLARTHTELETSSAFGTVPSITSSSNRTGLLVGAGAIYDISKTYFAKAGWDHYDKVGGDSTGKANVDVVSVGVGIRF